MCLGGAPLPKRELQYPLPTKLETGPPVWKQRFPIVSVVLYTALGRRETRPPRLQPRQGSNLADFPTWHFRTRADPGSAMPLTGGGYEIFPPF